MLNLTTYPNSAIYERGLEFDHDDEQVNYSSRILL